MSCSGPMRSPWPQEQMPGQIGEIIAPGFATIHPRTPPPRIRHELAEVGFLVSHHGPDRSLFAAPSPPG